MLGIVLLAATAQASLDGVKVALKEVVEIRHSGSVRAWDAEGRLVPDATDPSDEEPPLAKHGYRLIRLVVEMKSAIPDLSWGMPTPVFKRWRGGEDVSQKTVNDRTTDVVTLQVPQDLPTLRLAIPYATGPFKTLLDQDMSTDDAGRLKRRDVPGESWNHGAMEPYELPFGSPSENKHWELRGTYTKADGSDDQIQNITERAWALDPPKGFVILLPTAIPKHIKLEGRPYKDVLIEDIPLHPN